MCRSTNIDKRQCKLKRGQILQRKMHVCHLNDLDPCQEGQTNLSCTVPLIKHILRDMKNENAS